MVLKKLFYKEDKENNTMRISKTKTISVAVFIIIFLWAFPDLLFNPKYGNQGVVSSFIGSIIIGLICTIPVFLVGSIIGKLFNISSRENWRLNRIEAGKTSNEEKLINIAKNDPNVMVRQAAVENPNLKDQSVLIDIAKNDPHMSVRCSAVKRVTDEDVLIDIAKNDSENLVCQYAIENPNLKNESFLTSIAKSPYGKNNVVAIERITDENVLIDIARNSPDAWVRRAAFERITDETVLRDLARNYNDEDLEVLARKTGKEHRCGACNKLVSPEATKCPHCGVLLRGEEFKGYKK